MTLERYRLDRIVIVHPETPVYDAARAMESNHVGLVVVTDHHRIAGVITDRDIALRVVGFQLDPMQTRLKDVMTEHPATIDIGATEPQAIELMRDRHVRRLPLVDNGRVVGMVTIDDLILSDTVDARALREVVRAQLAEPAPLKAKGELHPTKPARYVEHATSEGAASNGGRAPETTALAARRLQGVTGLETAERALGAFDIFVSAIVRRLTTSEATDLVAQLPSEFRERWLDLRAGSDRSVTFESIAREVERRLKVEPSRAEEIVRAVGAMLSDLISEGELEDVRSQLPLGLREIL